MTRINGTDPRRTSNEETSSTSTGLEKTGSERGAKPGAPGSGWTPTSASGELAKSQQKPLLGLSPLVWERVPEPAKATASKPAASPASSEESIRRALEDQSGIGFGAKRPAERPAPDATKVRRALEQQTGSQFDAPKEGPIVRARPPTARAGEGPRGVSPDAAPPTPTDRVCDARYQLEVRRYAPFDSFGVLFHGDGQARGMQLDPDASHRVGGRVSVDMNEATARLELSQGQTEAFYGRETGTPRGSLEARETSLGNMQVRMSVAGNNPLVPGAPDIDSHVDARLTLDGRTLRVEGELSGDAFPDAELILRDSNGTAVALDHFETSGGTFGPFYKLMGGGDPGEPISTFRAEVPLDDDCKFETEK